MSQKTVRAAVKAVHALAAVVLSVTYTYVKYYLTMMMTARMYLHYSTYPNDDPLWLAMAPSNTSAATTSSLAAAEGADETAVGRQGWHYYSWLLQLGLLED